VSTFDEAKLGVKKGKRKLPSIYYSELKKNLFTVQGEKSFGEKIFYRRGQKEKTCGGGRQGQRFLGRRKKSSFAGNSDRLKDHSSIYDRNHGSPHREVDRIPTGYSENRQR